MANRVHQFENALRQSHEKDMDWTLLPREFYQLCQLFGKGMKQQPTTVMLGFLALISFCMGHSALVMEEFWTEPIISWFIIVLPTGRCKSAFHQFLQDIITDVEEHLKVMGEETKTILLPHCTWDKFGDILANNGARTLGLFDEFMSFLGTMNMYSSNKMQISDTKEFQDLLQMYTGKTKTRETVTGNANFSMEQTSLTMFGFTQPHTAMPVIEDTQNNAKGFTSRFLWYFPKPIFCSMETTILTEEEKQKVRDFRKKIVSFLAGLYVTGESTYVIEEADKITKVVVNRKMYSLTADAMKNFITIHNDWELNVCKQYPFDPLIGGLYSRGKSYLLRLSVPIQLLLDFWEEHYGEVSADRDIADNTDEQPCQSSTPNNTDVESQPSQSISPKAIDIASSIVSCSLLQLCILNNRRLSVNGEQSNDNTQSDPGPQLQSLVREVLLTPGTVISYSILNGRGAFRKEIGGRKGKALMDEVVKYMRTLKIGEVQSFYLPSNKSKVHYFVKEQIPEDPECPGMNDFIQELLKINIDLKEYNDAYKSKCNMSEKHNLDYTTRKDKTEDHGNKRLRVE